MKCGNKELVSISSPFTPPPLPGPTCNSCIYGYQGYNCDQPVCMGGCGHVCGIRGHLFRVLACWAKGFFVLFFNVFSILAFKTLCVAKRGPCTYFSFSPHRVVAQVPECANATLAGVDLTATCVQATTATKPLLSRVEAWSPRTGSIIIYRYSFIWQLGSWAETCHHKTWNNIYQKSTIPYKFITITICAHATNTTKAVTSLWIIKGRKGSDGGENRGLKLATVMRAKCVKIIHLCLQHYYVQDR